MFSFEKTFHFFSIAQHSQRRSKEILAVSQAMSEGLEAERVQDKALMLSFTSVAFAAFTVEAAINSYGRRIRGKEFFEAQEGGRPRPTVIEKWKKWPLAQGADESDMTRARFPNTRGYEPLKGLILRRDSLAHGKLFATDNTPADVEEVKSRISAWTDHVNQQVLERFLEFDPVDAVRLAMRGLSSVDPRYNSHWVDVPLGTPFWEAVP